MADNAAFLKLESFRKFLHPFDQDAHPLFVNKKKQKKINLFSLTKNITFIFN